MEMKHAANFTLITESLWFLFIIKVVYDDTDVSIWLVFGAFVFVM